MLALRPPYYLWNQTVSVLRPTTTQGESGYPEVTFARIHSSIPCRVQKLSSIKEPRYDQLGQLINATCYCAYGTDIVAKDWIIFDGLQYDCSETRDLDGERHTLVINMVNVRPIENDIEV